jgi:hypothetical protein
MTISETTPQVARSLPKKPTDAALWNTMNAVTVIPSVRPHNEAYEDTVRSLFIREYGVAVSFQVSADHDILCCGISLEVPPLDLIMSTVTVCFPTT